MSKVEVKEELNALASRINRMEREQKNVFNAIANVQLNLTEREFTAALRHVYVVLEKLVDALP